MIVFIGDRNINNNYSKWFSLMNQISEISHTRVHIIKNNLVELDCLELFLIAQLKNISNSFGLFSIFSVMLQFQKIVIQ